jgi:tetratricopeptide (TPR) repeat protein
VLARLGRWDEARPVYRAGGRTGIRHHEALANLAVVCEQGGDPEAAAENLNRLLALWPDQRPAFIQRLASLYIRLGRPGDAVRVIASHERRTFADETARSAAYDNTAGAAWLLWGDRDEAERRFESALRKDPGLLSARRNLEQLRSPPR